MSIITGDIIITRNPEITAYEIAVARDPSMNFLQNVPIIIEVYP